MTTPYSTTTTSRRCLILGDCHAVAIGRAANAAGFSFGGGPLGVGRDFSLGFFDVRDGDLVFRRAEAETLYRRFLDEFGVPSLRKLTVPVVSTFGFTLHRFARAENWRIYRQGTDYPPGFLNSLLFEEIVLAMARHALDFYRHVLDAGLRTLAVMSPQRVPESSDPVVFMAAQEVVRREVEALGVEVVDLRFRVTDGTGMQRPEFCLEDDPIHGNLAFGRLVVADLLARGL